MQKNDLIRVNSSIYRVLAMKENKRGHLTVAIFSEILYNI